MHDRAHRSLGAGLWIRIAALRRLIAVGRSLLLASLFAGFPLLLASEMRAESLQRLHADLPDGTSAREFSEAVARSNHLLKGIHPMLATATGDGGRWVQLPPPQRFNHAGLYDPVRDRLVLVGGYDGSGLSDPTNAVWDLPLVDPLLWQEVVTRGDPPGPMANHQAFFDSARDRIIVVLGSGYQVWALARSTGSWSKLSPLGTPPPTRWGAAVIHDPLRDRIVIFGGIGFCLHEDCWFNDVWQLSLTGIPTWEELLPTGPLPTGRQNQAAIYDPVRDRMLTFGGQGMSGPLSEVWSLALADPAWSQVLPSGSPPSPRGSALAVYDPVGDRLLVLGGTPGPGSDLWALSLSGAPTWQELHPVGSPPPGTAGSSLSHDTLRHRFLLYGGQNGRAETWVLDLDPAPAWIHLDGPPSGRSFVTAIADEAENRLVVFGGSTGGVAQSDTWTHPLSGGGRWTRIDPGGSSPPERAGHTATFDPLRRRMVVFGNGVDPGSAETWILDLASTPAWSQVVTEPRPPGRYLHAAAYDPRGRRILVLGGLSPGAGGIANDIWSFALDGDPVWSELHPAGTPPTPTIGLSAVYDSRRNRLLVLGRNESTATIDKTWELSLEPSPAWSPVSTAGSPGDLFFQSAVYDSARDRMLVFDGVQSRGGEVWELSLSGLPTWARLAATGRPPRNRTFQATAMDGDRQQLLVFGGLQPGTGDPFAEMNDLEALQFDIPTPTLLSVEEAAVEPGVVRIIWRSSGGARMIGTVYRSTGDGEWIPKASITSDGSGRLLFEDRDFVPGRRYGYRLGVYEGTTEAPLGEIWLDTPVGSALTLSLASPNPAVGTLSIAFSLPAAGSATLELWDVTGRRVFERMFDGLHAGANRLTLNEGRHLRSGVYLLRLSQTGKSVSTKVAVVSGGAP